MVKTTDPIVLQVMEEYNNRSIVGINKYGKTMAQNDGELLYWLQHIKEELMDATLYVQRAIEEVRKRPR